MHSLFLLLHLFIIFPQVCNRFFFHANERSTLSCVGVVRMLLHIGDVKVTGLLTYYHLSKFICRRQKVRDKNIKSKNNVNKCFPPKSLKIYSNLQLCKSFSNRSYSLVFTFENQDMSSKQTQKAKKGVNGDESDCTAPHTCSRFVC